MQTFGKGKPYTWIELVYSSLSIEEFRRRFGHLFHEYSRHIIPSWFLSNTKFELQKYHSSRSSTLFITTDFAENILVVRKHELADQFFHRIEILLFGAVASYVMLDENDDQEPTLHKSSYMVSSDYR